MRRRPGRAEFLSLGPCVIEERHHIGGETMVDLMPDARRFVLAGAGTLAGVGYRVDTS